MAGSLPFVPQGEFTATPQVSKLDHCMATFAVQEGGIEPLPQVPVVKVWLLQA